MLLVEQYHSEASLYPPFVYFNDSTRNRRQKSKEEGKYQECPGSCVVRDCIES